MEQSELDLRTPVNDVDVFHFDENARNFNDLAVQEASTYWLASDLMHALGYTSMQTFNKVINKAIAACNALNIDLLDNFEQVRHADRKEFRDYKLSRFACYLVAMNGDPKKIEVARAQTYFAAIAESFRRYVEEAQEVERLLVREELSDHEKVLAKTAKGAGVQGPGFALFQNAGYRGLYNMNISDLRSLKGIPGKRSPLDFMGTTELAANLFRITQTEEKIRNERVRGQSQCENTAEGVGREVRNAMRRISGVVPEHLAAAEDIKKIKGDLKSSHRDFQKLDKKPKQ